MASVNRQDFSDALGLTNMIIDRLIIVYTAQNLYFQFSSLCDCLKINVTN